MEVIKSIRLDLLAPNVTVIHAKQHDRLTRKISAELFSGSSAWTPPAGVLKMVRYRKPDGTIGFYDTDENGDPACVVSGSTVTIMLAEQALTVPGIVHCEVNFYTSAEERLTTFAFDLDVEESAVADEEITSTDYFNILTHEIALATAIKNMTADATTLATGQAATVEVEYDEDAGTVILHLGLPRGAQGEQGEPGSVSSVNGKSGSAVVLDADDVGAVTLEDGKADPEQVSKKYFYISSDTTLTSDHANGFILVQSNSNVTLTLAAGLPLDTEIDVFHYGSAGSVTVSASTGEVIHSFNYNNVIRRAFACAHLKKYGSDSWVMYGELDGNERLMVTGLTVAPSSFAASSTYSDYPYEAIIQVSGSTSNMFPEVVFAPRQATSGNYAPIASSTSDGVIIYAKAIPESNVSIASITLWR